MARFWTVFKKELTLVYRRRGTTLWIMAAPLLVILFLGVLFGGGPLAHRTLPVAVCNHDAGAAGAAYLDALEKYDLLDVTDYASAYPDESQCRDFLERNIRRGSFGMGLFFPHDFTARIAEGNGAVLDFWVDNSNAGLVGFQSEYVLAVTGQASSVAASQFVQGVWDRIRAADVKMAALQGQLVTARASLVQSQQQVALVRAQVEALPETGASGQSADGLLSEAEARAASISASAQVARSYFLLLSQNSSVAAQGAAVASQMQQDADALGGTLQSARAQVRSLAGDSARYVSLRQAALEAVDNVSASLVLVLARMDDASAQLSDARTQAALLTSKDPAHVVDPIALQTHNVFDYARYRQIDFVIYGILGLIVVLTSLLLASVNVVRERASGAYVRVALLPVGGFAQAMGKGLAVLVVLALQLAVMLFAAMLVFGVALQNLPWLFLFGLLLGFAFASAGLVIGSLTRSENSAILAAIALFIPLTFVSGLVTPYELMPATLQAFTSLLPLTFGINAMKFVSLYNATPNLGLLLSGQFDFVSLSAAMLALEAFLLFLVAAVLLKRMKP